MEINKEYTFRQISALVAKDIGLTTGGYESTISFDRRKEKITFIINKRDAHQKDGE